MPGVALGLRSPKITSGSKKYDYLKSRQPSMKDPLEAAAASALVFLNLDLINLISNLVRISG